MSLLLEKHKKVSEKSLNYTPTSSVSLLTSVLNFRTAITLRMTFAHVAILLSFMQPIEEYLLAIKRFRLFLILRI